MRPIIPKISSNYCQTTNKVGDLRCAWPIHTLIIVGCLLISSGIGRAEERVGAWEIICDDPADRSPCRAIQRKYAPDGKETILALTVLIPEPNRPAAGILSIPLGGYLAPGIEITIDKRQKFKLLVETCNPSGCHAGFPIQGRVLQALEKGHEASIRIWTTKNKPVVTDLRIDRFEEVISLLKRRAKP
ncbi:Invasion associated locus B (IalB) protein [Methylobacterium phyllostachyos]|uniref:Invasion associated locus B (IalB) protein n=1 Tax=Methylobacterium phyllostachyos TaxID=582672 RepID=A0A1H0L1C2_9HYPH|nr:invasion associated locus B family protein [Methylobacterium phyllostachyos]SDO62094.1 Invasion associated locus B (IalB) protein [Methylobacterium phyllostachyos]